MSGRISGRRGNTRRPAVVRSTGFSRRGASTPAKAGTTNPARNAPETSGAQARRPVDVERVTARLVLRRRPDGPRRLAHRRGCERIAQRPIVVFDGGRWARCGRRRARGRAFRSTTGRGHLTGG